MAEIGGSSRLVVQTFAQCRWNSHKLKQREISLHHCFRGRFKTRFFFTNISLYFSPKIMKWKTLTTSLQYYYHMSCVRESEKKERQIFKHELHKRKVEQSRLCMLFQVSKLNEHLSIINHSQNHMQIHFIKMREREKICIWFSPKRKLKNATKPTKLFSFYFLQLLWHLATQYTFPSCIVAWGLLTEKNKPY